MAAEVGSKAPDFTLVNQDRENVTLSQELGERHMSCWRFFPARSAERAPRNSAICATR